MALVIGVWLLIGMVGTFLLYQDVSGHWMDILLGPGTILRLLMQR